EDRVADEAVRLPGGEQRFKLPPAACGVHVPPRNRRKAGVPVELPRVVAGTRAGVGERRGVGGCALAPVLAQDALSLFADVVCRGHGSCVMVTNAIPGRNDLSATTVRSRL